MPKCDVVRHCGSIILVCQQQSGPFDVEEMLLMTDENPLVGTDWLAERLGDTDLRIVDVRWGPKIEYGKGSGFDDYEGYLKGHIPGAAEQL